MLNNILLAIGITLMYSTPLALAGQGSVISEVSGVVNIGIEGMMTMGAFFGAFIGQRTGNPWLGFLFGGLAGALCGLVHAFASVTCKADQTVTGIAMNLIGPGIALFACRLFYDGATQSHPVENKIPKLLPSGVLKGAASNLNVNWTTIIALLIAVAMWYVFYHTTWGLHIRAVGEHPAAADTLGINVYLVRYISVIISGFLAGLGGASMTLGVISQFSPTAISGQGFIAIAAIIFGKWTPHGGYLACLLFGFFTALTVLLGDGLIPIEIVSMLPYVATIIILILFVGRASAPKANGKPYEKGSR